MSVKGTFSGGPPAVMVDDGHGLQPAASCQMVARAQRAVDENRRGLGIVVERLDDVQRRVEQVDQMAIFRPDDRPSADQLDRAIEPLLEERIQAPPGGHRVGVGVVVRDDPYEGVVSKNVEQAFRLKARNGSEIRHVRQAERELRRGGGTIPELDPRGIESF